VCALECFDVCRWLLAVLREMLRIRYLRRILSIPTVAINRALGGLYAELRVFYPDLIGSGPISHQFGAKETENSSTERE
jgi:hypothetical protein